MATRQLLQERSDLAKELDGVLPRDSDQQVAALSSERAEAQRVAADAERRSILKDRFRAAHAAAMPT